MFIFKVTGTELIPRAPKLRISIGMPNFEMPNLDSVNHCTSDFLTGTMVIVPVISLLVQWLVD